MTNVTSRDVTATWRVKAIPLPANWGDLTQLVHFAGQELGARGDWDTAAEVVATDDELIVCWEKTDSDRAPAPGVGPRWRDRPGVPASGRSTGTQAAQIVRWGDIKAGDVVLSSGEIVTVREVWSTWEEGIGYSAMVPASPERAEHTSHREAHVDALTAVISRAASEQGGEVTR